MRAILDLRDTLDAAIEAHKTASPFLGSFISEARQLAGDAITEQAKLRRRVEQLERDLVETKRKAKALAEDGREDVIETSVALAAHMKAGA